MWMSEAPSLVGVDDDLLTSFTSSLSLCSIGLSSSRRELALEPPSRASRPARRSASRRRQVEVELDRRRRSSALPLVPARRSCRRRRAGPLDRLAAREHRHHLHVGVELDLVDRGAARRVVEGDDQAAVADQQRHDAQPRGDAVAAACAAPRARPGRRRGRRADSPSCAPAPSAGPRARRRPSRTSTSPSGTLRSSCCWTSASFSCASLTMPSESSASPMRTSGILCCALDRLEQLLGR